MKKFPSNSAVLAIALTLILATSAYPHGGGIIRLASKQVVVGGTIALSGQKLEKNADLKLELRGVLDNYPAGRLRTDAKGNVSAMVTIPPAIPVGGYTLVAIAADGDVAARTDVSVGPAAAAAAAKTGMPHMAGDMPADMPGMMASAEMMKIDRNTTPAEWAVIIVLIMLSLGGGAFLLARSRRIASR